MNKNNKIISSVIISTLLILASFYVFYNNGYGIYKENNSIKISKSFYNENPMFVIYINDIKENAYAIDGMEFESAYKKYKKRDWIIKSSTIKKIDSSIEEHNKSIVRH